MATKTGVKEQAEFIQHHLPGLDPGEYALEVKHEFTSDNVDGQIPGGSDITDTLIYKFAVTGPRFSIDPNTVHSVFPADGSLGEFSNVLPHVVLVDNILPWTRKAVTPTLANGSTADIDTGSFPTHIGGNNENYDLDVPTWLAVLILTDADYKGTGATLNIDSVTVGDFFKPLDDDPTNPSFISPAYMAPAYIEDPTVQPPWIKMSDPCQAIRLPVQLFNAFVPSMADLFMMANVRKVSMTNKPIQPGADTEDIGTYSIVMGNRIPVSGQRHTAVLVSLENMQAYLPDHNGIASSVIPSSVKYAMLPVLAHWSFISDGDSYQFDFLLESLNGRASNGQPVMPGPLPKARMKMYMPGNETEPANNAIDLGYIPLTHITRNNLQTASWYRGPLAPFAFNPGATAALQLFKTDEHGNISPGVYSADALVRMDPANGLFEASYAAAWQLGRLLALQDKSFSTTLYQWKRNNVSAAVMELENNVIEETFPVLLQPATPGDTTTIKKSLIEATMAELIKRTKKKKK